MTDELIVSWSEIDSYRQCPFKHHLQYRERWTPETTSPALARGTLWHRVMETWYEGLQTGETARAAENIDRMLAGPDPEIDLIRWMFTSYLAYYAWDRDWAIQSVEETIEVPLPGDVDGRPIWLKMKIDLIVKIRPRLKLWVVDHKSSKDLPNDRELALDDQFGLYTWGVNQLGYSVIGALHNCARTYRHVEERPFDQRFQRTLIRRSARELDTIAAEAVATVRKAYATNKPQERNPNTDTCKWRCAYLEPCLASRKGGAIKPMLLSRGMKQDFTRH